MDESLSKFKIVGELGLGERGRCVIANQDFPPGALVLKEKPLVIGPRSSNLDICVECCSVVLPHINLCAGCGHTVCQNCNLENHREGFHLIKFIFFF